jgi:16S rRNA processing protein RimM
MATEPPAEESRLESDDAVVVGVVLGPSGLDGAFKVQSLTDYADRFSPGNTLFLKGRPAKVTSSRRSKRGLFVQLDIVNNRTQAESLRGTELTVSPGQLQALPEDSYYFYQIIGIDVWDEGRGYLGKVTEILQTGANDVYVARGPDGAEVLIPAIADILLHVRPGENRMVVRLPEGL